MKMFACFYIYEYTLQDTNVTCGLIFFSLHFEFAYAMYKCETQYYVYVLYVYVKV